MEGPNKCRSTLGIAGVIRLLTKFNVGILRCCSGTYLKLLYWKIYTYYNMYSLWQLKLSSLTASQNIIHIIYGIQISLTEE